MFDGCEKFLLAMKTLVCADLASSFLPCTDKFPAAAVPAAAGFDVLAGSTLGTSALTTVAAVAL